MVKLSVKPVTPLYLKISMVYRRSQQIGNLVRTVI